MHGRGIEFLELELPDDTSDDVLRELPAGEVLTYLTLGFETGSVSSSIMAYVALQRTVRPVIHMKLVGGWIWYPPVAAHAEDLVWAGRIIIPAETFLRLRGTNVTGLTKTIRVEYIMEKA